MSRWRSYSKFMAKSIASGKHSKAPSSGSNPAQFSLGHFKWPLGFMLGLLLVSTTSRVQSNEILTASFYMATGFLFVWAAIQMWQMQREGVSRGFFVLLRQLCQTRTPQSRPAAEQQQELGASRAVSHAQRASSCRRACG